MEVSERGGVRTAVRESRRVIAAGMLAGSAFMGLPSVLTAATRCGDMSG